MKTSTNDLRKWMMENGFAEEVSSDLEEYWELKGTSPNHRFLMKSDWRKVENRMHKKAPSKWYLSAAAILLILLSSTIIWLTNRDYNIIRSFSQEQKTLVLPDGSAVELSKGSRLKYPKEFSNENRMVELRGEASFDVIASAAHPFIVDTGSAKIRVTGTTFLVSAFKFSEQVEVQVKAGKVLFYNSDELTPSAFRVGLGPGETGIYLPRLNQVNKKNLNSTP